MLRRLHPEQPASFAFTEANQAWAEAQLTKFPEGRHASAIIPLLFRAQEQEGWLTRPAIEHVADMLGMARIRALEVATFYFMFQLQPVGAVAHLQICGTTPCMLCGADDLIRVCKEKIAPKPHQRSADGRLSWEEVECLGACANAPMAQIGKDYYEDLTPEGLAGLIDRMAAGEVPTPGSQSGRFASEPATGLTSLETDERLEHNGSVALAVALGDTLKRIDGTEVPLRTPWREPRPDGAEAPERDPHLQPGGLPADAPTPGAQPSADEPVNEAGITKQEVAADQDAARPAETEPAQAAGGGDTDREAAVGRQDEGPAGRGRARADHRRDQARGRGRRGRGRDRARRPRRAGDARRRAGGQRRDQRGGGAGRRAPRCRGRCPGEGRRRTDAPRRAGQRRIAALG